MILLELKAWCPECRRKFTFDIHYESLPAERLEEPIRCPYCKKISIFKSSMGNDATLKKRTFNVRKAERKQK